MTSVLSLDTIRNQLTSIPRASFAILSLRILTSIYLMGLGIYQLRHPLVALDFANAMLQWIEGHPLEWVKIAVHYGALPLCDVLSYVLTLSACGGGLCLFMGYRSGWVALTGAFIASLWLLATFHLSPLYWQLPLLSLAIFASLVVGQCDRYISLERLLGRGLSKNEKLRPQRAKAPKKSVVSSSVKPSQPKLLAQLPPLLVK